MDLQEIFTKHKYKILAAAGLGGLLLGAMIYSGYQEEMQIAEEIETKRKEEEELNKDIYSDKDLVKALKEIKKRMYPVFHTLHLKADKIKKEIVRREGTLPQEIEKILFTMLTMRGNLNFRNNH